MSRNSPVGLQSARVACDGHGRPTCRPLFLDWLSLAPPSLDRCSTLSPFVVVIYLPSERKQNILKIEYTIIIFLIYQLFILVDVEIKTNETARGT